MTESKCTGNGCCDTIDALIDGLKNKDIQVRHNSVRNLSTIAVKLGVERTRSELIPNLRDLCYDGKEVLLTLAEELGDFTIFVGGPTHAHSLLPFLECLATAKETAVRDKALQSLRKISNLQSTADFETYFVPFFERLATGDWSTYRIAACGLVSMCYQRVSNDIKDNLRREFWKLCRDVNPRVRREATVQLSEFFEVAELQVFICFVQPLLDIQAKDEDVKVRVRAVKACYTIAYFLPPQMVHQFIVPILCGTGKDKSWRVRYATADELDHFQQRVGNIFPQRDMDTELQYFWDFGRVDEDCPDKECDTFWMDHSHCLRILKETSSA